MRKFGAYTLLELLIVLSVILILTVAFLAVFLRTRENTRQIACLSNLRQLATATQQYCQDHEGQYPRTGVWKQDLLPLVQASATGVALYRCPSNVNLHSDSYYLNFARLNLFVAQRAQGTHESEVKFPANTPMYFESASQEELEIGRAACGATVPMSLRHSGGSNIAFVDGHVKWMAPLQAAENECALGPLPAPFHW